MRTSLIFLLNGEEQHVTDLSPHTTVLRWLRENQHKVGTKEGCAEGDCGACTLILAQLQNGKIHYRAINSCIALLASLDGKALITVESLSSNADAPHPIQRTLAQKHASQCGFCTPGMVMSMAAHTLSDNPPSPRDTLAGNLCRCTGYAPIVEALNEVDVAEARAHTGFADKQLLKQLEAIHSDEDLCLQSEQGRFMSPASAESLGSMLAEQPDSQIIAGGTDVGLWITKQDRRFDALIALNRVRDLDYVHEQRGWLEIGAAATYSEAQESLQSWHPTLGTLLRRLGSTQIRNSGTVVGNIANGSPIGDMPPALIALGATLVIASADNSREIRLQDYFIDYGRQDRQPGEYLKAVRIPPMSASDQYACYKITKRFEQDISAVSAGFWVDVSPEGNVINIRICYGGMAATPKRAAAVESALMGLPWRPESVSAAVLNMEQDFRPLSDWRASADYRMQVAKNLLLKFALESQGDSLNLYHSEGTP